MKNKSYIYLCIGFLFILMHFQIQLANGTINFDILPDIIGYGLFAIGLHQLRHEHEQFRMAKNLNWYLLGLSIFNLIEVEGDPESLTVVSFTGLISIVQLILLLRMVYRMLEGIQEVAAVKDQRELLYLAQSRWDHFLAFNIVSLLSFIIMFIPVVNVIFIFGLLIWMIVIAIMMMSFMYKSAKLL
ncbi:hypothetical protein [Paenibacillus urinalis]|uniref:Uncharacterized protein n=1 Tax=Paenibacillus urinalis TaxID=521520 RepID=A0AAX3MVC7_9BACL|nr:hypothetical protein [Paenibacillus urinalis]WDH80764.1 hypothetical protein PUW23_14530 [Paenibacillus urinalis]